MRKLPFVGRIFFKVLAAVLIFLLAVYGFCRWTGYYEVTTTDIVGASMSGLIFCYLVHLWLLPGEEPPEEDSE
jgi:hypothetical protein